MTWRILSWVGLCSQAISRRRGKHGKKEELKEHPRLRSSLLKLKHRANVKGLATNFSHFTNVAAEETRHEWSPRIVFQDRVEPAQWNMQPLHEPWKSRHSAATYQDFYNTLRKVPDGCVQRTILVEDLSPSLIDLLGATFQIPPHVFEEHLEGGGYVTTGESLDSTTSWHTRSSAQGFSSITWYRPVLPLFPMTARFRRRLVKDQNPLIRCVYDACEREHNIRLGTTETYGVAVLTSLLSQVFITRVRKRNSLLDGRKELQFGRKRLMVASSVTSNSPDDIAAVRLMNQVILLLDLLPVAIVKENMSGAQRHLQHRPPILVSLLPRPELLLNKRRNFRNKDTPQTRSIDEWVAQTSNPSAIPTSRAPASSLLPSVLESGPVPPPPLPNVSSCK